MTNGETFVDLCRKVVDAEKDSIEQMMNGARLCDWIYKHVPERAIEIALATLDPHSKPDD